MARLAPVAALALLVGCGGDRSAPSREPLPKPDERPAVLGDRPRSPRIASYRIDARYRPGSGRVSATQTLSWKNTGTTPVSAVPLHLYMNAFKNETTVFMRESRGRHRRARAADDGWGWIEVSSIRLGDTELRPGARFPGPDQTVLEVPLPAPVAPGQRIELDMTFEVQLPEVWARTGTKGEFAMIAQWFPKIGVRAGPAGDERWHCEPFHYLSEFFADFGTYDVSLTVPDTHVVAATGVLERAEDHEDGTRTLTYRAEDVHDFAWMADPHMEVVSGVAETELGEVEVRVYHRPGQRAFADRHLAAGIGAIEEYSRRLLPYPWPVMSIVDPPPEAASGAGGMEYPTLVTTAGDSALAPEGVRFPEFVTIHEVGHNWFQGILASNEVDEAWLDEGVNEYTNGIVMGALYGEGESMLDWGGLEAGFYRLRAALGAPFSDIPVPIASRSYEFPDAAAYGNATYAKTAVALRTLEGIVGRERFRAALAAYVREHAFSHPTGDDLVRTLERELDRDLGWFFDPAFRGRASVDLRVRSLSCEPARPPRGVFGRGDDRERAAPESDTDSWRCDVVVENLGGVPVPVDVDIRYEGGGHETRHWDGRGFWHRFEVRRSSPVREVILDPRNRVPLEDHVTSRGGRRHPDRSAARRAAERGRFWTQTVMQAVGL